MLRSLPLAADAWIHRRDPENPAVTELVQSGTLGMMIRWAAQQTPEQRSMLSFSIRRVTGIVPWDEIEAAARACNILR